MKTASMYEIMGKLYCPVCRKKSITSRMIATKRPGFLRCGADGNTWNGTSWSRCNFSICLETPDDAGYGQYLVRPDTFPTIDANQEQVNIRRWWATAPKAKGGRLGISNAGPGTGKTTTAAWSAQALWERFGSLEWCYFLAFNRNARIGLMEKLPWQVSEIYTLNAIAGRFQGYKGAQYNECKLDELWEEFIKPIREKPEPYEIKEVIDRMRALCLYTTRPDDPWWKEAIDATMRRFGTEATEEMMDVYYTWIPRLATAAHQRRKTIDLSEQWCRAVNEAIAQSGFRLDLACAERDHEWTATQIAEFGEMIKKINLPTCNPKFVLIDEAQDLSLGQMALFLAATWKNAEVFLIGDDANGDQEDDDYKAGQGIYGWRGAVRMKLFAQLWKYLTHEAATYLPLTETHRNRPEVIEAFRPLNRVLHSSRPAGGYACKCSEQVAMSIWLQEEESALWITRTNKAASKVFVATLRCRVPVAFRAGKGFDRRLDGLFWGATGVKRTRDGEYDISLDAFMERLTARLALMNEHTAADSLDAFVLELAQEIAADPTTLDIVEGLPHYRPTVGNVRRLLLAFTNKKSARCVTNVYRVKGDEADLVIVSDADQFNKPWNGDEVEMRAVQHVAFSRARDRLVCVGEFSGLSPDVPVRVECEEVDLKSVKVQARRSERRFFRKKV